MPMTSGPSPSPIRLPMNSWIAAARGLNRIGEGRPVDDRGGIEQHQIRKGAGLQDASALEPEDARWQPGHLVDRRLDRKQPDVARIVADDAREAPP